MASSKKASPSDSSPKPGIRSDSFRLAARQAASWLRQSMRAQGLAQGATTYQYILNQLPAKMGRSPPRPIPNIGGEPFRPSAAAQKMERLAASLAGQLERLCAGLRLPPSQMDHVVDELSVELMSEIPAASALPASSSVRSDPTRSALLVRKFKPVQPSPTPSAIRTPAASQTPLASRTSATGQKSAVLGRARKPRPSASLSGPSRSIVPSRSADASERLQYEARLTRLTADLRQLLALGPKVFGPIPSRKREYVEQLLALIEEHELRYRSGQAPDHFHFSMSEKRELEDFCPAFKLRGLEWLPTEGPAGTS